MLTATGIGSGLDIEGLVTQLVAAERAPVANRLLSREAAITTELSAFGTFKGALADLQASLASLNSLATFGRRSGSSSNSDIVTVSADSDALASSYDLTVSQLAKAHSLASDSFAAANSEVGTGTLTIRFGTTDYTAATDDPPVAESYNGFTLNSEQGTVSITIDSSNNTLEGVRDAINAADAGVSAVIVNDGSGYRLLLRSEQTGAANSLEISAADDDANNTDSAGLSALVFNASATNLEQTVAAQDAMFTINGLSISNSNNTVEDVIEGVTLSLLDVTGATPVTVSIEEDKAGVKQAIEDFINGYNGFVETISELTRFDADTLQSGPLQGDFSARAVVSQLRQALTSAVEGFSGPFNSLSEIGITTTADGTLSLDSTELDAALENHFDDLVGLFAAIGRPTDTDIAFVSASDATTVGSYAVNITQLATRGVLQGSTVNSLVVDDDNDTLSLTIDGTASGTISLTQGTYADGAELASELQARINGDSSLSNAGASVLVSYDSDNNRFEITSAQYGASSSVAIVGVDTTTAATLGLSVGAGTDGVDVAGTIGGFTATGSGQILSGLAGTATEGLQLLIEGDTTGNRGTVAFSQGIAYQLNQLLQGFLESDGLLDARTDSLQARIDDIAEQRDRLDLRMETIEARIRRQFNALDGLLAQLQTTSNFLTQQLANLPKSGLLLNNNDN